MGHRRVLGALVALTTAIVLVVCGCASEPSTVSPGPTVTKTTQERSGQHHDSGGSGQHEECPGGTTVTGTETCPSPVTCGNGSTVYSPETCPTPTTCGNGSTVYSPQTCPPPDVNCPDGTTAPTPGDCPPVIHNQVAPGFTCSPGGGILGPSCSCPSGWDYVGSNDGSNGKCVSSGPPPVVHGAPLQPSPGQGAQMLSRHGSVSSGPTRSAAPETYSHSR